MSSEIFSCISSFFSKNCFWFSLIGKLYVIYLVCRLLSYVWYNFKLYFLSPTLGLGLDVKKLGSWAVVTGSTDGIGKSYAELLAKKGMNIILISRSPEKLKTVANEIKGKYSSIDMKCLAVDFSLDLSMYKKIGDELKGLDIGVLVNNVGMSHSHPEFLLECNDKDLENIVNINCFSVVFMTKLVLAQMVEKKKGLIINISSLSAHQSTPLLTTYAASKAFVRLFSKSIEAEYKSKGITVQCVSPGFVATKMSKIKKSSFMVPSADKFASSALSTAGLHSDVTGHFSHELMLTCMKFLGKFVGIYFIKQQLALRDRAAAKKAKSQ